GGDRRGQRNRSRSRISLRCIRATRRWQRPLVPPKQSATDRQQQRKDHDFGAADALRAALAVIPRKYQHHDKANRQREDQQLLDLVRPPESLRDDIQYLDHCKCKRDVRQRPLHQLALLESDDEFGHVETPLVVATGCASAYFFNSTWKRGSLRSGSQTGSSRSIAGDTHRPAGIASNCCSKAMASSLSPARTSMRAT